MFVVALIKTHNIEGNSLPNFCSKWATGWIKVGKFRICMVFRGRGHPEGEILARSQMFIVALIETHNIEGNSLPNFCSGLSTGRIKV
jgi:hypothetical protein